MLALSACLAPLLPDRVTGATAAPTRSRSISALLAVPGLPVGLAATAQAFYAVAMGATSLWSS